MGDSILSMGIYTHLNLYACFKKIIVETYNRVCLRLRELKKKKKNISYGPVRKRKGGSTPKFLFVRVF